MANFSRFGAFERKGGIKSFFTSLNVTGWLILINVVAFIIELAFSSSVNINSLFALQANNLFNNGYYWILLTSMFMHAGILHLFVNMFSLFFIGRFLEMIIGKKRFFWLYILSGIFASFFFAILSYYFGTGTIGTAIFTDPNTFAVGASGAIFAIAGVLAFLTPKNKVYLIAGPLIALIAQVLIENVTQSAIIVNIVGYLITLYIFASIFFMFSFNPATRKIAVPIAMPFWILPIVAIIPLVVIGLFVPLPIGNMAHLGGFIAGAAYGLYLRLRYKKKTKIIAEYYSS